MRIIKFRGKEIHTKKWVNGSLLALSPDMYKIVHTNTNKCKELTMAIICVIPETVGQYTGLRDKNGKEIYEGDIVIYDDRPYNAYGQERIGVIVYYKGHFALKYFSDFVYIDTNCPVPFYQDLMNEDFFGKKAKIIGNIIDNPELLN